MTTIAKAVYDRIIAHAVKDSPLEACGFLTGNEGVVLESVELTNTDRSADHYSLDPAEQFRAVREARSKGMKILAVYHSHPASPARMSAEDLRLAFDPDILYVIVSLMEARPAVNAFRVRNGAAVPEQLEILL